MGFYAMEHEKYEYAGGGGDREIDDHGRFEFDLGDFGAIHGRELGKLREQRRTGPPEEGQEGLQSAWSTV